uniref:Uncharacterized protein n=1 Tax=Anguilla anguilla TaxID=7936 RepID=A0A0E9UP94_ANGAN
MAGALLVSFFTFTFLVLS